jgi:hypothetical protein
MWGAIPPLLSSSSRHSVYFSTGTTTVVTHFQFVFSMTWKSFSESSRWLENVGVTPIRLFVHIWVSTSPISSYYHQWYAVHTVLTGCPSRLPNGNVKVSEKPKRFTRDNALSSLFPQPTLILIVSTGLLVLLFLSAAFLLYRIGRIHNQFSENPILTGR